MLHKLLTPRWIITTLLVIAAAAVMVRLGFWQLDRLAQRKASNAAISAQINGQPLDLNAQLAPGGSLTPDALNAMQYRRVTLKGEYRPNEQVILRNQVYGDQPGYHLLTPLYIQGTPYAVMVDRGWIPMEQKTPDSWSQYNQPGTVEITGQIQPAQNHRAFGAQDPPLTSGQTRLDSWNTVNLERISKQVQGQLLPVYVELIPAVAVTTPPIPQPGQPDLSEGPHMGYALEWFSFTAILLGGYPVFVRKQLRDDKQADGVAPQAQRKIV